VGHILGNLDLKGFRQGEAKLYLWGAIRVQQPFNFAKPRPVL
jgi:hypothetical protein